MTAVATFTTVDLDRADEIIAETAFADMVEDSEVNEFGVMYTLDDGSTVTVDYDGNLTHNT